MKRDCSTCICKEGSCYPSITIFDKDKTCKSYAPDYEGYIAELEEEVKKWKDEWQEQVQKATDEGYARTLQTIQLSKAKEIMQKLIANAPDTYSGTNIELQQKKMFSFQDAVNKAEQFLSEVEK